MQGLFDFSNIVGGCEMSFLIGVVGVLISLIGWFGFHSLFLLILGTVLYIIETILEWKELNTGAVITDLIIFGIGSFVSNITKTHFYIGGMIAVNCYSAIMCLFALPMYIKHLK